MGPPLNGLRDDEDHRLAIVGVTQLTQRTDLELIGSGRRQAADSHLFGAGQRHQGPGTEDAARAFLCVMHVEGKPCIRGLRVTVGALIGLLASSRTSEMGFILAVRTEHNKTWECFGWIPSNVREIKRSGRLTR